MASAVLSMHLHFHSIFTDTHGHASSLRSGLICCTIVSLFMGIYILGVSARVDNCRGFVISERRGGRAMNVR